MIKNALQGIADAITSEDFARLFIVSDIMFFLGMIVGVSVCDYSVKKKCDEMSITEALKYPYCRNYFEKELEKLED